MKPSEKANPIKKMVEDEVNEKLKEKKSLVQKYTREVVPKIPKDVST